MTDRVDFIPQLAEQVSSYILSFLDAESLLACTAVSERWNEITNRLQPEVWFKSCLKAGIIVKENKYQDAREWKAFISAMLPRLRDIKASNSYVTYSRTFKKPITAIYYYKKKIAVAYERIVAILDTLDEDYYAEYECNFKPSHLKFDDNILVSASASGYMSTWSIRTENHLRDYIVHGSMLLSFDFLSEYNILVSSNLNHDSTTYVYIWGMSSHGGFREIDLGLVNVYKVILAVNLNIYHTKKKICFLFCLTRNFVVVWTVRLRKRSFSFGLWNQLRVPPDPSLHRHVSSLKTVGFLFNEEELYIMAPSERSSRTIWVWNFKYDKLRHLGNNDRIINLLGVGEIYLVYKVRCTGYDFDTIYVVDKYNNEERAVAATPRITSTSDDSVCLGHTSWLDGKSEGEKDSGIVYAYITEDKFTLRVVRIDPRSE